MNIRSEAHYGDGAPPPPLEEVSLEFDRNGGLDTDRLPTCGKVRLTTASTVTARQVCGGSMVGTGLAHVAVEPGEQPTPLRLTLFNGGTRLGVTTVLIHSHAELLTPKAVIAVMKLRKVSESRYGLKATVAIPRVGDQRVSVMDFEVNIPRLVGAKGTRQPYALARCSDERIQIGMKSTFVDGTILKGTALRACSPRKSGPSQIAD